MRRWYGLSMWKKKREKPPSGMKIYIPLTPSPRHPRSRRRAIWKSTPRAPMSRCCYRIVDGRWCGCRRSRHRRRKKRKPVLPENIGEQIDEKQDEHVKSNWMKFIAGVLFQKWDEDPGMSLLDRKMKNKCLWTGKWKNPSDTKILLIKEDEQNIFLMRKSL